MWLFISFSGYADVYFREGNEPGDELTVTYRELLQKVCQFANVLKAQGRLRLPDVDTDVTEWKHHDLLFIVRLSSPCLNSSVGVKKGDRVSIYMPMVVELVVAMLACVRIGAVHSIVVS